MKNHDIITLHTSSEESNGLQGKIRPMTFPIQDTDTSSKFKVQSSSRAKFHDVMTFKSLFQIFKDPLEMREAGQGKTT